MSLKVSYDEEFDILWVRTGEPIETSSSCEKYPGLVVDFKSEADLDPVGFELMGASKVLAPFLEKMRHRATTG